MGHSVDRIACIGMATYDTILLKQRISAEAESVNVLDHYFETVGGKGLIAATALRYCSAQPVMLSMVAPESAISRTCATWLPSARLLPVLDHDHRTWITVNEKQETVTYVGLGKVWREVLGKYTDIVISVLGSSDMVYLSTEDIWLIGTVLRHIADNKLPLVTNLCHPLMQTLESSQAIRGVVSRSTVLLMNERESNHALRTLDARNWASVVAPTLREVIITRGSEGGVYSERPFDSWFSYRPVRPTQVKCIVGAGDTFNGAYVAQRFGNGYSMPRSCQGAAELVALKIAQESTSLVSIHRCF